MGREWRLQALDSQGYFILLLFHFPLLVAVAFTVAVLLLLLLLAFRHLLFDSQRISLSVSKPPCVPELLFFFVILSRYGLKLFSRLNMRGISEFRDFRVLSDLPFCPIKYATLWLQHMQHCSHFSCSSSPLLLLSSPPPPRPTPLSFSSFSLTDPVRFVLRVYLAQVVFALAAAVAACFLSTYILALNSFLVFFCCLNCDRVKNTHTHSFN